MQSQSQSQANHTYLANDASVVVRAVASQRVGVADTISTTANSASRIQARISPVGWHCWRAVTGTHVRVAHELWNTRVVDAARLVARIDDITLAWIIDAITSAIVQRRNAARHHARRRRAVESGWHSREALALHHHGH